MSFQLAAVSERGLPPGAPGSKRVVILGAGMAGLAAAYELDRAGHEPIVLEAQNRVGGRVFTLRSFAPGLYAEAGAMRLPRSHRLTMNYVNRLGLPLRPFVMGNPKCLIHIGGVRMTAEAAAADPSSLPFELGPHRGRHPDDLWGEAIGPLRAEVERGGWASITERYDRHSLAEFLEEQGWSPGAIEAFAVLNFLEADLNNAFLELLREELGGAYVDMWEIEGGMDRLPNALYAHLQDRVRFGAEVFAIEHDQRSVTVHVKTEGGRYVVTGDYAICTLPFSVLRSVEAITPFSRDKHRAIRQLNYHASTKVLFQVRHRRWESEDGIFGGGTVTDLGIRRLNYPTPDPATTRGILLASYTWGQDALQWGAMDEETRLEEALDDVSRIHPWIREEFEVGASHAWYGDRWARGAFALFTPSQQTSLQDAIVRPEGRLHFAGEHCSLHHAWIEGAIESGLRAAAEIHQAP